MRKKIFLTCILILIGTFSVFSLDAWIRINQLGYTPNGLKKAVLVSESALNFKTFSIHDALTNEKLSDFSSFHNYGKFDPFSDVYILDFSQFQKQGAFYLKAGFFYSPIIYINKNVYNHTADFLLQFMRGQRCGENPLSDTKCHLQDGFEVYGTEVLAPIIIPETEIIQKKATKSNLKKAPAQEPTIIWEPVIKKVDAAGGWHNDIRFIKHGSTSATSIYQMLMAFQLNPDAFTDHFDEKGKSGANGMPDILDEAKWGLDWLLKMYPEKETLYYQVADDRNPAGTTLPQKDRTDFGQGKARPVFRATGKPQGLLSLQNQSTGIASIAGKYVSAFALGADILGNYYPEYKDTLTQKAFELYEYGKKNPGVCQSAPAENNLYYAEDNWADDMQLAAIQLYYLSFEQKYLDDAARFGRMEPVSPWVFSDTAAHYQWYPFINIGHFKLANIEKPAIKNEFTENIKATLQRADLKRKNSPFQVATPSILNSNNYVVALATQCHLYRRFTGDFTYLALETALTDWIFGCNPWGISMVVGLPNTGNFAKNPYYPNATFNGELPQGALVNGPISKKAFENLSKEALSTQNDLDRFQGEHAVYHDDSSDFSTNQPTFDGTASLMYLLSSKQYDSGGNIIDRNEYERGGVIRTNPQKKQISLVFSGHDFVDGRKAIYKILKKQKVKASFFLTGDFLRNRRFKSLVKKLQKEGHYIGAHSDKYLTYCDKTNLQDAKISKKQFTNDLQNNYNALSRYAIKKSDAPFFLPSQGIYNDSISRWAHELGLTLVNFTPGIHSNADNSIPEMREGYFSSLEIYNRIMEVENNGGLNGYIMLFHTGSDKRRTDKFYKRLDSLIRELKNKGYSFSNLYESTLLVEKESTVKNKKRKH